MITAEIKINGCLIGHIYLVNRGATTVGNIVIDDSWDDCKYEGHFYSVDTGIVIPIHCTHLRSDGAIKLINIATKEILKQLNKKEK